jgi:hypothetical protein
VIEFFEKRQHAIDIVAITNHITLCVVSPLLVGPSTTQSIALNQILTKSFDMIFQESTMRPKKITLIVWE